MIALKVPKDNSVSFTAHVEVRCIKIRVQNLEEAELKATVVGFLYMPHM